MDCDAPTSQVVHTQYTADHIASQVVEDQDLPYRISIGVEYGCGLWDQAVCSAGLMLRGRYVGGRMIKVEYPLNRGYVRTTSISSLAFRTLCLWQAYLLADLAKTADEKPWRLFKGLQAC